MKPRWPRIRAEAFAAIAATILSVAALFVAWDQARVMRTQVRAAIWPALQVDGYYSLEGGALLAGFRVHNAGVGPAVIRRVNVSHGDDALETHDDLAAYVPEGYELSYETLTGRILGAGAEAHPFTFAYPAEEADALIPQLMASGDAWRIEVCYCSAMDQCWIRRSDDDFPTETPHCEGGQLGRF